MDSGHYYPKKIPYNVIYIENISPIVWVIKKFNELQNSYKNAHINISNTDNKRSITDSEGTPFSISSYLNITQHNQVAELLTEFNHIFSKDISNIKAVNEPKFNVPHRVSLKQREKLQTQLDKLSYTGIVKPIILKFAAPAFLVKKKKTQAPIV